jgi:thiol-disulfide isomerase/thioredoxin
MKINFVVLFLILISRNASAQSVEPIKAEKLATIFNSNSDIAVVNAWATWCKPCLEEMHLFAKVDSLYQGRVNFVFISFDYVEDTARVNRMIAKLQIPGRQYLIDETDMDLLINTLDSNWSGTLPATWFICNGEKISHYTDFRQIDDIKMELDTLIAKQKNEK